MQNAPKGSSRIVPILLVLVFVAGPAVWMHLTPNEYVGGRSRDVAARQARNASSLGLMLGEFRTGISDILMIKTERYLHGGVGYQPHIADEVLGASDTADAFDEQQAHADHAHDEAHGVEGDGSKTLIPPPDEDYRGWIGWLHRNVKPWLDPSQHAEHSEGTQVLPWFRIATLSDPHHIRGYALGAYWLQRHDPAEAEKFLQEGIENNPNAFQLHLMAGQLLMRQARRTMDDMFHPTEQERPMLEQALQSFSQAAELALAQRPHGNVDNNPGWGKYDEDDAWASYRMAVLSERQYGSKERAQELAAQGAEHCRAGHRARTYCEQKIIVEK